jgi:small conductance mechanosensitive channel
VPILDLTAAIKTLPPPTLAVARVRLSDLLSGDTELWRNLLTSVGNFAVNLLIAAVILVLTLWASGWAARAVRRGIAHLTRNSGADTTLQSFVSSLTRWAVIIIGVTAVLQQLGVRETSILAVLGAASLAVGLAIQGALSNVAAGVMILILRPYRVGDVVEVNGRSGTVKSLDLFATLLSDADNLDVFVPNSKVFGDVIINYSTPANRRMELSFRLHYEDDLDQALAVLLDCAKADKRVLAKPAPDARVTALGDSAVTLALHAWAPVNVYWDVRFEMIRRAKLAMDAAGFVVPYPHQVSLERQEHAPPKPKAVEPKPVGVQARKTPISDAPSQS